MILDIKKIKKSILIVLERFFLNYEVKRYIQLNKFRFKRNRSDLKNIILIDFLDSYPINETYAYIANNLAFKYNASIKYFRFEYDKYDLLTFFLNYKTKKIYNSFNANYGFSYNIKYFFSSLIKTYEIFKNIKSKQDVVNLVVKDLNIGDLVYDTYLRKFNQKTLNIKSYKFFFILFQTIIILKSIENYFSKNNVKAVIPGDVSYIYSGLVAKYAIKNKIKVYSIIETNGFLITELQNVNYYRRMPYWEYSKKFAKFSYDEQKVKIKRALNCLERRLSGKKDSTLVYMAESTYKNLNNNNNVLLNTNKLKVLVALHDFFDSPHIYRYMIFPDFWEWIIYTLNVAKDTDFEWYIKPHPNALPQNKKIISELKEKYKDCENIFFISPFISNLQLINEDINAVVTVYGSIGHEFAYFNKLVINAGDNPHIAYNFNIHAKNLDDYTFYLKNIDKLSLIFDKNEIGSFFYMHYLYYRPLKLLNPVYPPTDYINYVNTIQNLTSKQKRVFYHKNSLTLKYFIEKYNVKNDILINNYLNKVLK